MDGYIIEKIIDKNIEINYFTLSINGLIYNKEFANALIKLNKYIDGFSKSSQNYQHGIIFVSQSQFHQEASKEVIKKFSKLPFFIVPSGKEFITPNHLLPYGNAAKNNLTKNLPNIDEITNYSDSVKIVEYQGESYLVFKYQYISSNGNVLADGCISYDMMDKYQIGNVSDKPIAEMFFEEPKVLKLTKSK